MNLWNPKHAFAFLISFFRNIRILNMATPVASPVSNMLNKLHGQPDSYDKKYGINPAKKNALTQLVGRDIDSVERSAPVHMVLLERQRDRRERSRSRLS